MRILGIETSCDETAAAVVTSGREILSNCVLSQIDEHAKFGGVVPEVAARAHLENLDDVIRRALNDADCTLDDIDGVAATCGPGLIGGVMVGMMAAKAISAARGMPFLAINHMQAHALTVRLTHEVEFPFLVLLISGGHTQILKAVDFDKYELLGQTLDDAAGECFDKSAKIMGLAHANGSQIEKLAMEAKDVRDFALPRPMIGRKGCDFSFSGLKTATRLAAEKLSATRADMAPLASALQDAIADVIKDRCKNALKISGYKTLVASGGVAANTAVRKALESLDCDFIAPPVNLCGDNGAMIAWAGIERLQKGLSDGLDFKARPRWPLDQNA